MKFNFRKISAIGASLLMTGMTMGVAAAANYPAPFVSGGSANVAVVYGTGSGVSSLDMVEAGNIQSNLASGVTSSSGSSSVSGESILLERSTDKFNLGNSAATVFVTSVDVDDLPTLLADGTYSDDDNTEFDYTQKIELGSNFVLEHFADTDINDEKPQIGIKLNDDDHVLNYTLDFSTTPAFNASDMETTTFNLMGKEYYILDVLNTAYGDGSNKLTLLDTASSTIISEGETATVQGKSVSIAYISNTEVKLNVGGQTTNSLAEGGTYKLSDGTYVGIKDILYDSKDSGISKVEFSIGSGKLELTDGTTIELNDDTVEEITGFIIKSTQDLDKIVLQWKVDDEAFIVQGTELLMPGFGAVKVSFGGFVAPSAEETRLEQNGDAVRLTTNIQDGEAKIDLLGFNSSGNLRTIGKDSSSKLVTSTSATNALYLDQTNGDKYFVASWNSTTEAESYFLSFSITTEDSVNKIEIKNEVTGDSKKIANASDVSFGAVTLTVNNITRDGSTKNANITINSGGSFHELYTKGGLKVFLPYQAVNSSTAEGAINFTAYNGVAGGGQTGHTDVSYYQYFEEEDKDENLVGGTQFYFTVQESGTSGDVHVSTVNNGTTGLSGLETEDGSDNNEYYVSSDLATKIVHYTGSDNSDYATITYAGEQSYGELYLTAPDASISGGASGVMLVKDTEVSSVSSKNLIVVGGSCINSAAASLVGGAYCGSAWTTATGVGSGQFLIKSYSGSSLTSSGKVALLVAGYEAADTVNAATYLRTQTVDTSKEYKGTSSTSADLVVA